MDRRGGLPGPQGDPLGAALLSALRHPRRRWAALGSAERVGVYTRQSLYGLLWVFNGAVALNAAVRADEAGTAAALVAGALVLSAAGHWVMAPCLQRFPEGPGPIRVRLAVLYGAGLVFAVVAIAAWDDGPRATALLLVLIAWVLPTSLLPDARASTAVVVAIGVLFLVASGDVTGLAAGLLGGAGFVFTGRASLWVLRIVLELDDARQAQAQLAVMEERLRFSRDVHDVLGRRLSTIAVQSELAATLAGRGDDRAAERMLEVRGVAHEALREARELARGYRRTDFATELDGARSLLRSAGIEVTVTAEDLPRAWHEPAGWVVREAVTNVLRHSQATVVEIWFAEGALRVANDGVRPISSPPGHGLQGLRERLTPLGARLDAGPDGDDDWLVVATLPGTGPLSATA